MTQWPPWWDWHLELSPHLLKRMIDRGFSEVELRLMMEHATGLREDAEPGRWIVQARHEARLWHIVVEPDPAVELLVVVTAYPVDQP